VFAEVAVVLLFLPHDSKESIMQKERIVAVIVFENLFIVDNSLNKLFSKCIIPLL
jgi:hypothetical protein